MTTYKYATIGGRKIFYREAGSKNAPTILLLHGFPTSSHMFRDLIPLLAGRFHLVAPDFPGFGQSDMPEREAYDYTFANIAQPSADLSKTLELKSSPFTFLITALPSVSASPCKCLTASLRLSVKTETPTKKA